jgi:hypothetical protein
MEGLYHELTWINLKKKIIFKVLIFYEKKNFETMHVDVDMDYMKKKSMKYNIVISH